MNHHATGHRSADPAAVPGPIPSQPLLGALLRAYRSEQRLTVNALADATGVARSQLCAILNGSASPGAKVTARLAPVLAANPPSDDAVAAHGAAPPRVVADDTPLRRLVTSRARELGLNLTALARSAHVGRTALFSWLAGHTAPSYRHLSTLATALDVPVDTLAAAAGVATHEASTTTERLRVARGWTLTDLAERAGVAVTAIRRLERGQSVRAGTVAKVAATFGVAPADLDAVPTARRAPAHQSTLAAKVSTLLTARAWTSADLAAYLGVQRQQLSAWRSGVDPVPARYIPALAELFGMTGDDLAAVLREEWSNRPSLAAAARRVAARKAAGLRQRDVAEAAHIAHTTYTRWECGRGYLHERHLQRVAQLLGAHPDELR